MREILSLYGCGGDGGGKHIAVPNIFDSLIIAAHFYFSNRIKFDSSTWSSSLLNADSVFTNPNKLQIVDEIPLRGRACVRACVRVVF